MGDNSMRSQLTYATFPVVFQIVLKQYSQTFSIMCDPPRAMTLEIAQVLLNHTVFLHHLKNLSIYALNSYLEYIPSQNGKNFPAADRLLFGKFGHSTSNCSIKTWQLFDFYTTCFGVFYS